MKLKSNSGFAYGLCLNMFELPLYVAEGADWFACCELVFRSPSYYFCCLGRSGSGRGPASGCHQSLQQVTGNSWDCFSSQNVVVRFCSGGSAATIFLTHLDTLSCSNVRVGSRRCQRQSELLKHSDENMWMALEEITNKNKRVHSQSV